MRAGLASVAAGVAGLTLAARLVGFGRSLVFSKTVGDTCLGDTYNAANSLPNVLFEIVAGGVLAGVVVPVVARHVGSERSEHAARTASALMTWTLLVLTPAGLAVLAGARLFAATFAKADCAGSADVLAALVAMFAPQVWLYGLAVVSAGILQAHHRFLAAAAAPLLSSAVVIMAYLSYAALAAPAANDEPSQLTGQALAALGWGTTLGVLALAVCTLVPLGRLGLRLRPRLRFAAGDRSVIVTIAAAGIVGLVLQQLSVLLINWSAQQTGDQGALTRFTWANAIYLLPYAVLAAPLLQLSFPRLAAAAEQGRTAVGEVLAETGPVTVVMAWLGAALLVGTAIPVARVFVLGPGSGRTEALAWPIVAFAPAIVGFTLLGLASRTLLAQHLGKASGVANAIGLGCGDHQRGAAAAGRSGRLAGSGAGGERVAGDGRGCRGGVGAAAAVRNALRWAGETDVGQPGCRRAGRRSISGRFAAACRCRHPGSRARCGRHGCVVCRGVRGDTATSGTCAARAALGAATPYTFSRGGFIMKVAQLLTASTGGIGRHVGSIAPRLEQRGHQVRVFCPKVTAEAQGFHELGLDVWPLTSLRRFTGADLVHAHGLKAGWLGLPIAWMFKVPLVVTWHNAVLGEGLAPAAVRQTLRAVALGADLTLAASGDLVAQAVRFGARNARLSPIAAPVLPPARISRDEQRRALGAGAHDTVVLTVSRLAPQKNLGMVLDIAAAVRDKPDLRFVVVGEGPGARCAAAPHYRRAPAGALTGPERRHRVVARGR